MTKKERIIAKQKELIELLNKQVEFICSDICIMDSEKFGYIACDFSQKITTLEHSISSLESEPDEELFRKVYIKSDADLPKENGRYIVRLKDTTTCAFDFTINGDRLADDPQYWIDYVKWYLTPQK